MKGEVPVSRRSYLYVPGDRPDLLAGAFERSADALIVDLEDSVVSANKGRARASVAECISNLGDKQRRTEVWVRVNSTTELLAHDLHALNKSPAIAGISIPKIDGPEILSAIEGELGGSWSVIALIESALGLLAAPQIAAMPRVTRLALGEVDLMAELGVTQDPQWALASLRMQLVVASAAAGIEAPIAPVSTDFRDLDAFRISTTELQSMGFGARSAIHPDQVLVINEVFTPSEQDLVEARRIVEAADRAAGQGSGVFVDVDGQMVDEAIVRRARRQLAEGERRGIEST